MEWWEEKHTSVLYPRYVMAPGITNTYSSDSRAVRGVHRKYRYRFALSSALISGGAMVTVCRGEGTDWHIS